MANKPRELTVHFKHAQGVPMASDEFWLSLKPQETIQFREVLPDRIEISREEFTICWHNRFGSEGTQMEEMRKEFEFELFGAVAPDVTTGEK